MRDISAALETIGEQLRSGPLRLQVQTSGTEATGVHRLIASRNRARVQIETTPVMRGTVHPVRTMRVRPGVEQNFGFAEMQVLDFADLYAGKLSAALSRQHPRDLFDMQPLLDDGRLDERLWRTFLVYLTCSPKPAAEMLAPQEPRDFEQIFGAHFQGILSAREISRLTRRPRWLLLGLAVLGRFPKQRTHCGKPVGRHRDDVLDWLTQNMTAEADHIGGIGRCRHARPRQACLPFETTGKGT